MHIKHFFLLGQLYIYIWGLYFIYQLDFLLGFISKGVKRIWNQIWNYFFKGFIGTMLIIFGFPIICMSACFMSIFLALTAPLWIPVSVIALHLFIVLIYDIDSPNAERNRYLPFFESIVKIIAQGLCNMFGFFFLILNTFDSFHSCVFFLFHSDKRLHTTNSMLFCWWNPMSCGSISCVSVQHCTLFVSIDLGFFCISCVYKKFWSRTEQFR